MNVKFQEGVGRAWQVQENHSQISIPKSLCVCGSQESWAYTSCKMLFLNIIIAVKFGRKLVLVYHVHLNTKKVVEFFFLNTFLLPEVFLQDHLTV